MINKVSMERWQANH